MITGQWHISPNSEPRNGSGGGTWYPTSSVIVQLFTDVEITDLSIPIIQYDPYDGIYFDVDVDVDGVRVFHETVLLTGELNEKIFYDVSPNIRADKGSTLSISATVAPVTHSLSQYDTRATAVLPWGDSTNSPVLEVIISGSYAPIWTIDSQNDGYPYPIGTDPTPFIEFEKDSDGYPLNWGVWKLDGQNDGYPWLTNLLPMHPTFFLYVLFRYLFKDSNNHSRLAFDLQNQQYYTAEDDVSEERQWVTPGNSIDSYSWEDEGGNIVTGYTPENKFPKPIAATAWKYTGTQVVEYPQQASIVDNNKTQLFWLSQQ